MTYEHLQCFLDVLNNFPTPLLMHGGRADLPIHSSETFPGHNWPWVNASVNIEGKGIRASIFTFVSIEKNSPNFNFIPKAISTLTYFHLILRYSIRQW